MLEIGQAHAVTIGERYMLPLIAAGATAWAYIHYLAPEVTLDYSSRYLYGIVLTTLAFFVTIWMLKKLNAPVTHSPQQPNPQPQRQGHNPGGGGGHGGHNP
jgi:hypothetical protein